MLVMRCAGRKEYGPAVSSGGLCSGGQVGRLGAALASADTVTLRADCRMQAASDVWGHAKSLL